MRDKSLSAAAGLASGHASMAPGGHSLHGPENDCVLTCSDGFEAAEGTQAESSISRQLLARQRGESLPLQFHQFDLSASLRVWQEAAAVGSKLTSQALTWLEAAIQAAHRIMLPGILTPLATAADLASLLPAGCQQRGQCCKHKQ